MKFFRDILTNGRGKYSAKRVFASASFVMACTLPLGSLYLGLFDSGIVALSGEFLMATLGLLGISSWQKTQMTKPQPVDQEELS